MNPFRGRGDLEITLMDTLTRAWNSSRKRNRRGLRSRSLFLSHTLSLPGRVFVPTGRTARLSRRECVRELASPVRSHHESFHSGKGAGGVSASRGSRRQIYGVYRDVITRTPDRGTFRERTGRSSKDVTTQ